MFSFLRTRDVLHQFLGQSDNGLIRVEGELLEKLQLTELEMLRDVNSLCRRENIDLMAGGGTLLGAVRHKGFIPWDDDIDLMIRREQVERFTELVRRELSDRYELQYLDDDMAFGFIKIRKKGTTYVEAGDPDGPMTNGVYLDVFISENVPDGALAYKLFGLACNARLYIATSVNMYENTDPAYRELVRRDRDAERNFRFRAALGRLFSWRSAGGWFCANDRFFSRYRSRRTRRVSIITGRGHYFGETFPREVYDQVTDLPFADLTVKAPARYETYLRQMYGANYMEVPPVEKREHHYVAKIEL